MHLTPNQLEMLRTLAEAERSLTGPDLVDRLPYVTSPEGAHQTAASLARRGYVWKDREGSIHRRVIYGITKEGRHTLAEYTKPRSGIKKENEDGRITRSGRGLYRYNRDT